MTDSGASPAVVLLSGGMDSATTLALAREAGHACHALSFRYGQRHSAELAAAERLARKLGAVEHRIIDLDLAGFGGSALTDHDIAVPERPGQGIPVTYVPARNTVFLSIALAWAEVLEADDIWIGVNAVDYSGYPDCRPEFIAAWQAMANLATRRGVEGHQLTVHAPLIELSKAEIILRGKALGLDYR
ncbi:MAG: 7-cyano-7-deazaguanine synthase QueC, partial [Gammaproteobacteria bacterium]